MTEEQKRWIVYLKIAKTGWNAEKLAIRLSLRPEDVRSFFSSDEYREMRNYAIGKIFDWVNPFDPDHPDYYEE